MSGGTGLYVYGVIAGSRRRAKSGRGLPGTGPVRLIELDENLAAAVADAPLKLFGEGSLARKLSDLEWVSRAAVAHESVLESFADATAVVPMKVFTLFSSEERAIVHLRAERSRIAATVKRVANQQEWGVRVALTGAGAHPRKAVRRSETGTQFLARKRADRNLTAELSERAAETVDALFDRLTSRASIARRRPAGDPSGGGGRLLLDAAFLVPRSKAKSFESAVAREARALGRSGYAVRMNGPWPAYSFVE